MWIEFAFISLNIKVRGIEIESILCDSKTEPFGKTGGHFILEENLKRTIFLNTEKMTTNSTFSIQRIWTVVN